jgi:CRISPR-associated endonuclease/helicase Cas3
MIYYAHTAKTAQGEPDPDKSKWQPLKDHLRKVAKMAATFAEPLGLAAEAELAGLLHDLGKYAARFLARLDDPTIHGINHWARSAEAAFSFGAPDVAYVVDGHHTGLPAHADLRQTLLKLQDPKAAEQFTACAESLGELIARYTADGLPTPQGKPASAADRFSAALRIRLLFSCLVDADFLDTEAHFTPAKGLARYPLSLDFFKASNVLHQFLDSKPADGPVNAMRRKLLTDCLKAARRPRGLFTLTAPTGSGKTLASLAFALRHAVHHNAQTPTAHRQIRRIIVVIPYTSIIEQTAGIYRSVFEAAGMNPGLVVEHHSASNPQHTDDRRARLATENWDAPVIITTNVQFFQSLFSNRPGSCRKLHNISNSVVLFDEVQTLPARLTPSLLSAMSLLARDYGVTAVFMTATQPAFSNIASLPYGWSPTEISSDPKDMAEGLRRTEIILPKADEEWSWEQVAARMTQEQQALCVVNSTRDARTLFNLLPKGQSAHLSARMCPAHRQFVLKDVRTRLKAGEHIYLASTQVIEAGVDIDFPSAFRAMGPLDSIIQTAGRCNREGKQKNPCPVFVFRPVSGTMPRGVYQVAAEKTEVFLRANPNAPLHQPLTYATYFGELYKLVGPDKASADQVYSLSTKFDFPRVASECRLIEEETHQVLVKWQDGVEIAAQVTALGFIDRELGRHAQRFSINLYSTEFERGMEEGYIIQPIQDLEFYVWNSNYDECTGAYHPEG